MNSLFVRILTQGVGGWVSPILAQGVGGWVSPNLLRVKPFALGISWL